jgi:hypothetical protein
MHSKSLQQYQSSELCRVHDFDNIKRGIHLGVSIQGQIEISPEKTHNNTTNFQFTDRSIPQRIIYLAWEKKKSISIIFLLNFNTN